MWTFEWKALFVHARHDATAAVDWDGRQRACMENTSTVVRPRSPFRCSSDSARSDADAAATGNSPPQPKPNSACAPMRNANVARGVGPAAAVSSAPAAQQIKVRPRSGSSDDSQPYHHLFIKQCMTGSPLSKHTDYSECPLNGMLDDCGNL